MKNEMPQRPPFLPARCMAEASEQRSSGWLEDVAVGALSGGVNAPTASLVKAAFAALLLPQLFLLHVALRKGTAVGHVAALLVLTLGLLAAVSWCARRALVRCAPPAR